jgi:hypothetical protein
MTTSASFAPRLEKVDRMMTVNPEDELAATRRSHFLTRIVLICYSTLGFVAPRGVCAVTLNGICSLTSLQCSYAGTGFLLLREMPSFCMRK